MSWIHIDDIVGLFMHALDKAPSGTLEGVAPQPVTNRQFTAAMCRSLGVIQNLPVPAVAIHVMFGERAGIVLGSTRLTPLATQASGFRCRFETVEHALDDLLVPQRGGVRERRREQWLPISCDASHLAGITAPPLPFRALGLSMPYALWHHAHDLLPLAGGTLVRDTVRYRLPAGWLGSLVGGGTAARDLERMFEDRSRKIDERLGKPA